ncbi:MAG TPA: dephospho-CoA kinase [Deltaproteobacteria bacterium]|nr:dephospho-CoA kinase [Deltaproteobacteria bacterium]HPJ93247.1 dephospho-CoA kinase [Deltaproteobacteria bacterium]HPR52824.1 dephospho-CoA kinase [Deltaproteobacteria bacterium]
MVVAGLTGGIATGKSTVAAFFVSAGAELIDADRIAFDAVQKGTEAWQEIVEHFGQGVLLPDGQIDRACLGNIIFHDHEQKAVLNGIVHPAVIRRMRQRIEELEQNQPDAVVIVDVPLLIETGMYRDMRDVILVYVPEKVQIERLMDRDGLSRKDALARVHSQMSIEEKKTYASIIIDNTGSIENTRERTFAVYTELQERVETDIR